MDQCMLNINNSVINQVNQQLRTFKLFKNEFKFENYLQNTRNQRYVCALFRFSISSHNLKIKTVRYTRPRIPVNDRTCVYCSARAIENESHLFSFRI